MDKTNSLYVDIIGTKGVAKMKHNFKTSVVELNGINRTEKIKKPFGGKNMDVLCDLFADSIQSGYLHPKLPTMRDSVVASLYAWHFLENAQKNGMPTIGNKQTLKDFLERQQIMMSGSVF